MLILIYGDDDFRVSQKVKQMRDAFCEKFDRTRLNTQSFPVDGSTKLDPAEILQAVCSYPFLGEKRMVVVRDLVGSINKAEQDVWVEGFTRMPASTIAVLWETTEAKVLEKKSLFQSLMKMSEVHTYPFPVLEGVALNKWVVERIQERGGKMDQQALRSLIQRVGVDLWQMSQEIDKLIAFANGTTITPLMVDALVHATFEGKIFEVMDAISKKQTSRAIQLLQQERWSGANNHYLLTMLGRQVRVLVSARSLLDENPHATKQELAELLHVHPFVAQKALEQARLFQFDNLRAAHDLLFDYDYKQKSGRIQADLAVDLMTDCLARK